MIKNLDLETILENMNMGVILIDAQKNILYLNSLLTEITGYTIADISNLEQCFKLAFTDPVKRLKIKNHFEQQLTNNNYFQAVFKIETKSGQVKDLKFKVNKLPSQHLLVNIVDVTKKIAREKEFQIIKERLELAVEAANIGIWDWHLQAEICYYNKNWAEMLGFKLEEIEHKPATWKNLIHPEDRERSEEKLNSHLLGLNKMYICEHRLQTKSGDYIWVRDIGKVVETDAEGNVVRAAGVHLNIDQTKKYQEEIEYLSFHDELTGLYNRRYLQSEIDRLNDSRKFPISIIMGDLDNLKDVNDSLGHWWGDEYIKKSAKILQEIMRNEDVIARVGGDEFAILLPKTDVYTVQKISNRIRTKFREHSKFKLSFKNFSISLGSCTVENKNENLSKCFDLADKNMYINKKKKKAGF